MCVVVVDEKENGCFVRACILMRFFFFLPSFVLSMSCIHDII